jgi:hypothetical protein
MPLREDVTAEIILLAWLSKLNKHACVSAPRKTTSIRGARI